MIKECEEIAKRWMLGNRQSAPGIPNRQAWRHPEDLVILIDEWPDAGNEAEHLKCVAWLHDIIEDGQKEDGSRITREDLLQIGIKEIIIEDVIHLTQGENEPKELALSRIMRAPRTAKIVKCIDRICNLREGKLSFKDGRWARYIAQTDKYIIPISLEIGSWFTHRLHEAMYARTIECA